MRRGPGSRPDVLVWAAAATLAVAATTAQLVDFGVYRQRLKLLDMMTHRSIFGIASLAVLAIAAFSCALLTLGERGHRTRFALLGALLAALLALRVAQPPHVLLLALPANAAALALLWTAPLPESARRVLRDGCVVLAFGVHAIGGLLVPLVSAFGRARVAAKPAGRPRVPEVVGSRAARSTATRLLWSWCRESRAGGFSDGPNRPMLYAEIMR